jgi:hypothetical protein
VNGTTRTIATIVLAGIWINASEFFRNQVLLLGRWKDHYDSLGLAFPADPKNAAAWVVWGFVFAVVVYAISRRFDLATTTLLGWITAFVMMWLVTWNLDVLPLGILWFAVPLSLLEAFVAALICRKLAPAETASSTAT